MAKRLAFKGPADREVYAALVRAVLSGKEDEKPDKGKDAILAMSALKKAVFAIGDVIELPLTTPMAMPGDSDSVARLNAALALVTDPGICQFRAGHGIRIKDGRQTLTLTTRQLEKIEKHIKSVDWPNVDADTVEALYDRIASAEALKEK